MVILLGSTHAVQHVFCCRRNEELQGQIEHFKKELHRLELETRQHHTQHAAGDNHLQSEQQFGASPLQMLAGDMQVKIWLPASTAYL